MRRFILIMFTFFTLLFSGICSGQELKVKCMEIRPTDLTARVGEYSRVDLEGRKTALLKIYVPDDILEAQGNVVGDVVKKGFEKWIYIAHDSKQVKLLFENHYPLMITFGDYNYPSVSEQMVYEIKLVEDEAIQPQVASPVSGATPDSSQTATSAAEIFLEAYRAYGDRDYKKAMQLFKKIDSDKEAQFYIGVMYDYGLGVPEDETEAIKWYRDSAEQGHASAQYYLGSMYVNGRGVAKDFAEGMNWLLKAAEQGSFDAQFNIGDMYANGDGVPKDIQEAIRWYSKAAEDGPPQYKTLLAIKYQIGQDVPKDQHEAAKWFKKAAEEGYAAAQYSIGLLYERGQGVKKDKQEAIKWYRSAAKQGIEDAKKRLKKMGVEI